MAFIRTIPARDAQGSVREMYERQQSKYGFVPNYAKVFSHRPEIMSLWADLLSGIRKNMDKRRFELVTVAAAVAVRSSYCSLAHGRALSEFYTADGIRSIVDESDEGPLSAADQAMVKFARKVARHASEVTADDTVALNSARLHGCRNLRYRGGRGGADVFRPALRRPWRAG